MSDDEKFLCRAFELAERGRGFVEPNPLVGAVIVRQGIVVGEGWHARYGGPHAEMAALNQAGDLARGATLFVTLEPCCHTGKTPPCTDAVIRAGITSRRSFDDRSLSAGCRAGDRTLARRRNRCEYRSRRTPGTRAERPLFNSPL